ncbi:MAG TPA: 30S ribosomal protein S7 [Bacteroidales bacterium]|jgi:small subunit ribosomal protein S7|nr:30S ribosomal protein S7 [Bacteroidales bacterium]
MRKAKPKKRILLPDPKFNDPYVTRFINNLMFSGKKTVAFRIFYDSLDIVGDKMKNVEKTPLEIWKQALDNITPHVEVKSRRVGGATFQVPLEIRPDRKVSICMKNLILFARKRTGHSMAEKLAAEVMAAYNQEGGAYKRKEDTHRMAEANKAFAHFRF